MDAEHDAYEPNNAALQSNRQDWWPAHLFVVVEVVAAAEDFGVTVADRVVCVARRGSGC